LNVQTVEYGSSAEAPADPVKDNTDAEVFLFAGWDKTFDSITADLTVTALFDAVPRYYTVTFKSGDETLDVQTVEYGSSAAAPAEPGKDPSAFYSYTFDGWDTYFDNVTGNLTVNAVFRQSFRYESVVFLALIAAAVVTVGYIVIKRKSR
jgi:hypothetical protein